MLVGRGSNDGLVASKILRRRDDPLNRQQWLFGERTVNQGPWLSKEEPCTSRITLHTGQLSPAQLLHLVDRGEYVMHQWLWDLPGGKERQFLYRREELQGAFRLFSRRNARRKVIRSPSNADHLRRSCVPDNRFVSVLRANPTICKAGKRHDLLMEAKRQVRGQAEGSDVWLHQQQAALDWLAAQGERSGFALLDTSVDAYRQQQLRRENSRQSSSSVAWIIRGCAYGHRSWVISATSEPGIWQSRAFGCGLMLIKPGAEA